MTVATVLNKSLKHLYKLLAILLVVFAVLISTLRLFLPYAHNYRQNVEDYINNSYNSNVSIGSLSMGWRKSGPILITGQVELLANSNSKVYIDNLEVELDFWQSIRSRQLVTENFVISGAELAFEQTTLLNSAEDITDDTTDDSLTDSLSTILLEQISRFSIRDSHLLYRTVAGERAFTINEMFWVNDGERHRANGKVIVDGLSSNNLKVLLDFKGKKFDSLSGQAYLKASEIDITPSLGKILAINDANTHSAINFDAWLNISAGKPETIQIALGDNAITWQHSGQTQTFEIIGGDVKIESFDELSFSIVTSPLTIKRNGIETNKISLQATADNGNVNGYVSAIELASFEGLSPLLFDDIPLEKMLFNLSAKGRVEDINFRTNADDIAISAKFNNIDSQFSHGIPGIDNVSGELLYSNKQLQISLNAIDGALDFDQHFKYPIPYTQLTALVNAKFSDNSWYLSVEGIDFSSENLNLSADLKVNSVEDQPVTMALLASASDGKAKYAEYFYPHLLMGQPLVDYLNGAIIDGEVKQALVLFNGPFQSFPFDNNEGVFVVDAELSESTFKFDPEWPAIDNFVANLNFTNDSMLITGREGTLSGIDVSGVQAAIASLSTGQILTVDADFKQTKPQWVTALMNASPMQDSVGATLEQVIISEPISGDFSLILPLNDLDAVIAKGHVDFNNNRLALQAPRMDFSKVNGRLDYHNELITADGVELIWRGLPLTINAKTQQKPDHYSVNIETVAQWQEAQWQTQLPDVLLKYGQGQLAWQGLLALSISDEKFTYDYQVASTLEEISLLLPAPFDKTGGEKITVNIHAFGDEYHSTINAEVGDKVDFYGLLEHQQTRFSLAHLVLGEQQMWQPTTGFHITADLAQAEYEQWQPLVIDILNAVEAEPLKSAEVTSTENSRPEVSEKHSLLSAPNKIHGQIANLKVYGEQLQQVNFDFTPKADWWLLNVNAKELRGSAKFYPDWHLQGIDIDADFVHLQEPEREVVQQELSKNKVEGITDNKKTKSTIVNSEVENSPIADDKTSETEQIDQINNAEIFANIPPLKVKCASCEYGIYDFGKVTFSLERSPENSLLLNNFIAERGKSKIAFDAKWQQTAGSSQTSIIGTLVTDNVAREVEHVGYASIIKDSGVQVKYDVTWQGGPHDFTMATFDGDLSAKFDDGYLADVDDKGVRILSLLSLQSLVRKLSFDFRDIFSDGMFYRDLQGSFTVKDGVAYTDNVMMKGTAGDLTIVGNTNLNIGELDYRMSYKPNLTSSLPVLAWIATLNPVTFLAGMALDEVITSTVIAEINFEVTGNLDEPQFKQVSRKNKNISVGRSSPPKIVDNIPQTPVQDAESTKLIEPKTTKDPSLAEDNING